MQTLNPAAAEIWTTYLILAMIAEKQGDSPSARDYRRQSRQAKWAYKGTKHELQRFAPLLEMVVGVLPPHPLTPSPLAPSGRGAGL